MYVLCVDPDPDLNAGAGEQTRATLPGAGVEVETGGSLGAARDAVGG